MLSKLFLSFFKLGFFAFGGGYAMIPLIEREVITKHRVIDMDTFTSIISISGSLPGAIGLNIAIFVGYISNGLKGAIVLGLASILPAVLLISSLLALLSGIYQTPIVVSIMSGIKPVVVAMIFFAAFKILKRSIIKPYYSILTLIGLSILLFINNFPVPLLILSSIVLGFIVYFLKQIINLKKMR